MQASSRSCGASSRRWRTAGATPVFSARTTGLALRRCLSCWRRQCDIHSTRACGHWPSSRVVVLHAATWLAGRGVCRRPGCCRGSLLWHCVWCARALSTFPSVLHPSGSRSAHWASVASKPGVQTRRVKLSALQQSSKLRRDARRSAAIYRLPRCHSVTRPLSGNARREALASRRVRMSAPCDGCCRVHAQRRHGRAQSRADAGDAMRADRQSCCRSQCAEAVTRRGSRPVQQ
jgi:hypothetical protein